MRRMRARDSSPPVSAPPRPRVLALDEPHEELLEPVHLVAHADDLDALLREAREDVVQALLLLHFDLDRVVVDEARHVAGQLRHGARTAQRKFSTKVSWRELPDHAGHRVVLDDPAAVDDRDVPAEALGFLEVVRRQDDRRALLVDLAQEDPHAAADLDVDARGRLVEDQEARLVHQRARDHEPPLHAARQRARDLRRACPRAAAAAGTSPSARPRACAVCRRSRPGSR